MAGRGEDGCTWCCGRAVARGMQGGGVKCLTRHQRPQTQKASPSCLSLHIAQIPIKMIFGTALDLT